MKYGLSIALVLTLAGCPKGENAGGGTGTGSTPSGGTTSSTTPMPLGSSAAIAPTPTETTPAPSAKPASSTAAVASAKPKDGGAPAARIAQAHIDGRNFAIDVTAPSCKADTECALTIKLNVSGDFHINKEYPYKFVATAAPNVTFLGKGDATTFSKAAGDFAQEGEKTATMTVRYRPASAGNAKVAGTYKLSVCNPDQCQIEQQPVSIDVPVL